MKNEKTINDLLREIQNESNFVHNVELATEIVKETNLNLKAFINKNYVDYEDYCIRWDLSDYIKPVVKEPFDIYRVENSIISISSEGEYIPLTTTQFIVLKTITQNPIAYLGELLEY